MKRSLFLCVLFFVVAACSAQAAAAQEPLQVGVAEADITPPEGVPVAGYYEERRATGTRDRLKARAVVFRQGSTQSAFVVCDLIGVAKDLSEAVRRRAADQTKIPASHIIVAATHSHTAPDYTRDLYEYLKPGAEAAERAKHPYAARLVGSITDAIVTAHRRARAAAIEAGVGQQQKPISFNRRFVMKDGAVRTWMRLADPNVVRPAGPIDPDVGLVLLRSAEGGQPLAVLSNFALHLDTVGGTLWSADYPYYLEQALRKSLGREVVSVFGTGCCGDINHVDPSREGRNSTEFIGRSLAATVDKGLARLDAVKEPTLRVRRAVVPVPLQDVSAERVSRARPVLLDARAGKKVDFFEHVAAYKAIVLDQLRHKEPYAKASEFIGWGLSHSWAGVGDHLPVEVQVIALGDELAFVCLPGEIFVELGLAIKRASPFRTTLVVELSGCDETLYVPTRVAYAGGSYEVLNSALKPGSGEMLVEAAVQLLREAAAEGIRAKKAR